MIAKVKQGRMEGLDILKCISCIGVVSLHIFQQGEGDANGIAFFCFGYSIPIFFMVNGYLLLSKKEIRLSYIFQKGLDVILFAFWWNLAWSLFRFVYKGECLNPITETLKNLFLQDGYFYVFWFLGALICVHMTAPILHKILQSKWWWIPLAVLFLICNAVDILSMATTGRTGKALQSFIPQTFRLWTWCFYFYLGGCIAKKGEKVSGLKKCRWIPLAVFFINVVYEYFIGVKIFGINLPEYFYDNILLMIETYFLFTVLYQIKKEQWKNLIIMASSASVGIYPLHVIVINYSWKIYGFQNVVLNAIAVILVFSGSLLAVLAMQKIPLVRRLVNISGVAKKK